MDYIEQTKNTINELLAFERKLHYAINNTSFKLNKDEQINLLNENNISHFEAEKFTINQINNLIHSDYNVVKVEDNNNILLLVKGIDKGMNVIILDKESNLSIYLGHDFYTNQSKEISIIENNKFSNKIEGEKFITKILEELDINNLLLNLGKRLSESTELLTKKEKEIEEQNKENEVNAIISKFKMYRK